MCKLWIPVMWGVNSSRMGFTRAVCCTSQPKLVFWSEISEFKVSQLTASYSPSSVRFTCSFWGSWIFFPARVQVNMICGGLKLLAQHSNTFFLFRTTSGKMMETSGGTVRDLESQGFTFLGYVFDVFIHIWISWTSVLCFSTAVMYLRLT